MPPAGDLNNGGVRGGAAAPLRAQRLGPDPHKHLLPAESQEADATLMPIPRAGNRAPARFRAGPKGLDQDELGLEPGLYRSPLCPRPRGGGSASGRHWALQPPPGRGAHRC